MCWIYIHINHDICAFFCTILAVYSWAYQPAKNAIRRENININCWTTSGSFLDHPLLCAESPEGTATALQQPTTSFLDHIRSITSIYIHWGPLLRFILLGCWEQKAKPGDLADKHEHVFFANQKRVYWPGQMWYKPQTNVEKEPKSQFQKVFGYSLIFTKQMYTHMIPYGRLRLHEIIIYP